MKLFLLLSFLFLTGMLNAQQVVCEYSEEVNTSLVITEARLNNGNNAYIEITNRGENSVRLSEFKLGQLRAHSTTRPVYDLCNDAWNNTTGGYMFLPDKVLDPGKSLVVTRAFDYGPIFYKEGMGRIGGNERPKQIGIYEVADKLIHMPEPVSGVNYAGDSVTTAWNDPEQLTPRGNYGELFVDLQGSTFYIEHHYTEGDSAVVDQVGGVFDGNGNNFRGRAYDIAGIIGGMNTCILVRKAGIINGNIDFASARGISLEDSEWIPIELPTGYNNWRDIFWTIGNHGNFELTENTLEAESEDITVDYAAKKITVPWGIRRLDDIMAHMKKKPGIAWQYDLNPIREDSLYRSARDGDLLTIYVVGNTLQTATFEIEVRESTADDNIVVPIDRSNYYAPGSYGPITTRAQNGILSWPRVTRHESGIDTITGSAFGLEFDLRTDTLMKYLEKPANATWEFVWVDDMPRPDLKDGDKLRVVSPSGKVKEYFIQVQTFWPSTDADLSSITWPDIPEFYRGIFGWKGDTIPNFSAGGTIYRLDIPSDIEEVPALKAKTSHVNATVKVTRARSLTGSIEDRTVTFEVTAEDDNIHKTYSVELIKEITPDKIEPFVAEPFISEFVNSYGNIYVEIFNPGNQPLDLRDYMLGMRGAANINDPITHNPPWERRYTTYIPGLKHVDEASWAIQPKVMRPDPTVNPIIPGGGTFLMAGHGANEWYYPDIDVHFDNSKLPNNWQEAVSSSSSNGFPFPPNGNRANFFALYKILNDSIKLGLKPIGDINDFEVIDVWGMPDRGYWIVGDLAMAVNQHSTIHIRKPHIYKGNPEFAGSFGTSDETSEWINILPNIEFGHIPSGAQRYSYAWSSLKNHVFVNPTFYKSTVNSSVYKVSDSFGPGEEILGLKTGTTVSEFLSLINKEDEGQKLKVVTATDGSELAMDGVINMNDKLIVVSADESNTTHYRLNVTGTGFSNDAYLTSNRWSINVSVDPKSAGDVSVEGAGVGSVSGFDYGTTVKTVVDNVTVPAGATLTVIDGNGAYVPFTMLNFDTAYVSVTVNPDIYLDVLAEDNVTRIVYQLQPNTSASDAFILSDVYEVSQVDNLIHFVPRGTNFDAFISNIIPSLGANVKLINKIGFERVQGNIREDDKVVVTSANGLNMRVYFISFLPTATILQTTYLAYVLSDAYVVDQVNYRISAGLATLTSETMLDEFMVYLMPSLGSTMAVVDKNGQVKSSGDLNDGDKLLVTSTDGKITTTYSLALDLTFDSTVGMRKQIEIFPNPASDKLNIQGVDAGNRIQIYCATGALIHEVKAQSSLELISLENVPAGMFMIVIRDGDQLLGRYKAIRK